MLCVCWMFYVKRFECFVCVCSLDAFCKEVWLSCAMTALCKGKVGVLCLW